MDTVGESITNRPTKVLQLKVATTDSRFEPFVIRENTNMYYIHQQYQRLHRVVNLIMIRFTTIKVN